jgi:hypothetical protein
MSSGFQMCIYCGQAPADTVDEVPPRCFFKPPVPRELIKVPACQRCNNEVFAPIDVQVRNWLMSERDSEKHPEVQGVLEGKRLRGLQSDPRMRNEILQSLVNAQVVSPAGLHLGTARALNVDHPAMDRFMERLGRALIHHETGGGFVDAKFDWAKALPGGVHRVDELARTGARLVRGSVRDDVFTYEGVLHDPRGASLWAVGFYRGPIFLIIVVPKT